MIMKTDELESENIADDLSDIKPEYLTGTFEQKKALVDKLNLMDDIFFSVVMEDKDACEYLLSRLMGMNIRVVKNKTQYSIRNLDGHSALLDLLVEDDAGKLYNVEVQGIDEHDHERRMRYYISMIDCEFLEKGGKYKDMPEVYVIFISAFDPFGLNQAHYEIESVIKGTGKPINDGIHKHYFNTAVDDGTPIAELMRYFAKSDANDDRFGSLSRAVRQRKVEEKGVESMCDLMRTLNKESVAKAFTEGESRGEARGEARSRLQMIDNLLADGEKLERALRIARIDEPTYLKYKELYGE